ncbi:MAG: AAA family ATPase [Treponema sp.]|nr:AAA family ATPase [Treponema sp.]MBQ7167665.1 AAA family ATPase [Treponema sp.]
MGIYLNPGNENFEEVLRGDIYVDKTLMISEINSLMSRGRKFVCVSRPRRFGKTIAGNMLCAYYSKGCDSRSLFSPYRIAQDSSFEGNLNKFNVIKIDLNGFYSMLDDKSVVFEELRQRLSQEFYEEFADLDFSACTRIPDFIAKVYKVRKEKFVIIIDEYDIIVRESSDDEMIAKFRDFLISLFKNDAIAPAIALAYITGILPIIKDKIQSKLNNFTPYTMVGAGCLSEYIGFTDDEVKVLCGKFGLSYAECRNWYDGYKIKDFEIYNPNAVVNALISGEFESYWGMTGTFDSIAEKIRMNFDGTKDAVIKMLAGEEVDVNVTSYSNSMTDFATRSDVFTFLIHLGYLAYNAEEKTCRIPNKEVRQEWFNAIEVNADYRVTNGIIQSSRELLKEAFNGNGEAVAKSLDISHIHVLSNRSYNNEDALQSAIYLSFIYALNKYTCVKEMTAGKGFADVVYIPIFPDLPALIIELKRNGSAESALTQIKEKRYFESLSQYSGNILFIGINYDEKEKKHECKIERFVK